MQQLLRGGLPREDGAAAPTPRDDGAFALTDIQYAYLIGRNPGLELGGISSAFYQEWDVGALDLARLEAALAATVARHAALRTAIRDGGEQAAATAAPSCRIVLTDTRGWDEAARASHLEAERQRMRHTLLPLNQAAPFEIRASLLDDGLIRLHLLFDLMFLDLRSVRIVMRDWWRAYAGQPLVELPAQASFAAYRAAEAALQAGACGERDRQYWLSRLDELSAAPELPLKTAPEHLTPPRTARASREWAADKLAALRAAAEARGLTAESLMLGAYVETLRQWSKQQSFTLTLTTFGRRPHFDGVADIAGNFLQPLLLPIAASADESFADRMARLQTDLLSHRWHAGYSGIQLLREQARQQGQRVAGSPVVFSNMLDADLNELVEDGGWQGARAVYERNQTPQVWLENQLLRDGDALRVNWNHVDGLFPVGMVEDMLDCYMGLLERCLSDEGVWASLGAVTALPAVDLAEREQANATETALPLALLHELVLRRARSQADAVAVQQGEASMSFGELARRAGAIAQAIRGQAEVKPGERIAVSLPQGPELIAAILGALIAGGAYVAIDPALPAERRQSLLRRCAARALLSRGDIHPQETHEGLPRIDVDQVPAGEAWPEAASPQSLDDLAYVIFTSGSTGEPKGVMISHRNAANTVLDINRRFGVNRDDAVFSVAPAGFDLSVYDYFGVLAAGGRVVFQDAAGASDPQAWCQTLIQHRVTIWNSVPAPVKALADRCGDALAQTALRLVLMSGDWIPIDLPGRIRECLPAVQVVSLGGATEGSIWSICHPIARVDPSWTSIPYGKPLANQRFHVLNDWLAPCPKWVTGELYIAGCGVAQGYLADDEKTAQRFIVDPRSGERLYKTGDLGRYLDDGVIEILGREDSQVKINGYRVELGEVEACLLEHPEANHVVLDAPRHAKTGQRHLVAYVAAKTPPQGDAGWQALLDGLRELASKQLPSYMVPSYLVPVDEMPLTANGKINRAALPQPWQERDEAELGAEPAGELENELLTLWRKQLRHEDFGVTDGFFDIGGDSLHAVGLLSALRDRYALTPEREQDVIEGLFMNASIRDFAKLLDGLAIAAEAA
ncbi:non-ribosomal peptide synthetase [Chromobacterium alticapitis]|uniref:Non-ribosomal peptide synthetase n=2 Tax=Chromobacterium alticapitis TaxID=2073169 RepID=A0A2S5DEK2_9NEIS|nr:non-ribosomal peptide synthetase [Chromobacterium alticapitis]